jgi:hypothetical protein
VKGVEFPIDETFLSSIIYEGLLVCKANDFNFDTIRRYILEKLRKIEKEKFEVISSNFKKFHYKCIIIDNFGKFKVKTDLKRKLPKQTILLLENTDIDKTELSNKIKDVSFLITDVRTAKILGENLEKIENYLILEERFSSYTKEYIRRYGKLPSNALICRENEKCYLYFGYITLRYDISSSGINDQYFFYYKGKSEEKGLEVDYNVSVLDRKIYAKRVGILTFLKGFLEEFKGYVNLRDVKLKPDVIKDGGKYKLVIDNNKVTGLQIFGCDRFSGFTSLETDYTTSQVTIYTSPEVALILLLGLASSFIISVNDNYYFLFFSSEETTKLYNHDRDVIRKYYLIRDRVIEILRDTYSRTTVNEIAITELALRLEFQDLLNRYNLDKVTFTLFKVALEKGKYYKIYEQIPITIYRKIVFAEIVERYSKNPDGFIKSLAEIFENRSKYSRLWDALKSREQFTNYPEADNVLKAMQSLYRFVVLGDLQGYYQFTREIFNCYRICASSRDKKNRNSAKEYKQILEKLRWF